MLTLEPKWKFKNFGARQGRKNFSVEQFRFAADLIKKVVACSKEKSSASLKAQNENICFAPLAIGVSGGASS